MQIIGRINSPKNGDRINRLITVIGEVKEFFPENYVWLAMQKKSGMLWLKNPRIKTKLWRIDIDYGNPTEDFSFLLLSVGKEGQCTIENWYRFGTVTGSYPGLELEDIPGAVLIDKVERLGLR